MENVEIIEEIKEENLYLRKISMDDVSFLFESLKEKEMIKYLSLGPLNSLDHSKKVIKNYLKFWDKYLQFNYIIELREGKIAKKIGSISLWNVSWLHRRAEIGVWVIPYFWNQGIGKKAINLIKSIGFYHLKLNRIEAHVAVNNVRSISLFKNCNFIEEGTLREYLNFRGAYHNAIVLACLNNLNE